MIARVLLVAAWAALLGGCAEAQPRVETPIAEVAGGERGGAVRPSAAGGGPARSVDAALSRAARAAEDVAHTGTIVVVGFGGDQPAITEIEVTRGDTGVRVAAGDGLEVGRLDGEGFLRSPSRLLRVAGVERLPGQLDRLHDKYTAATGDEVELDTGPAIPLTLTHRDLGVVREVLYLDAATGLVVRRETSDTAGVLQRIVAYTRLTIETSEVGLPTDRRREVQRRSVAVPDLVRARDAGFELPRTLPHGYALLAVSEVPDASVPTAHLVYGDGVYTLSLFQQQGRMAPDAVHGADQLDTADGGAVWHWPGSQPNRLVWGGDGATYTVLTDAPPDEVLAAVAGLPTDPAPSILERLARGSARVADWLLPAS